MTIELIAIFAGLVLGSAWTGAVAAYFVSTRSYRQARNLFVIGLGYLIVSATSLGSLFVLLSFCKRLEIERQSPQHYAALYAYALSCVCGMFFVMRAEMRWRKAAGLAGETHPSE